MPNSISGYNNVDFQKFVDFANIMSATKDGANAIARVTENVSITDGALAGRKVESSDTDSIRGIFKWFRSADDKAANNETRRIFKEAIAAIFHNNESEIPDSVKDAMRMADFDKGKPLTARRILIVKEAIDAAAKAEFSKATEVARDTGGIVFSHQAGKGREAEVYRIIDDALKRCGQDRAALEIVSQNMGSILLRGDCTMRSPKDVFKKVDGILANLKEMREAANGSRAALDACKDCLINMGGKSLPPGHLGRLVQMVAGTDTSAIGRLKPGSSAAEIDAAVSQLGKMTNQLMVASGVDKETDGSDEKDCIRGLVASLVIAKLDPSAARSLRQVLQSETTQKLKTFYQLVHQGDVDLGNVSSGLRDWSAMSAGFSDKLLASMKDTVDSALGKERQEIKMYPGRFDLSEINAQGVIDRIKADAREMMERQRSEKIAGFVNGDGPGAAEFRELFANVMRPEPHSGMDAELKDIQETIIRNTANRNIASECKKIMKGEFQNTAFFRDVKGLDVSFPDGSKMSADPIVARDQIAKFVKGGAEVKYDDLDDLDKGKANLVMAMLSQDTVDIAYDSHKLMLDFDAKKPRSSLIHRYYTAPDPGTEKKQFNLRMNDYDGRLDIDFAGEKNLKKITVRPPGASGSKEITPNSGSRIGMKITLRIPFDELNRLAGLDYSRFDEAGSREMMADRGMPGSPEHAEEGDAAQFLFNKDKVYVSARFSADFT